MAPQLREKGRPRERAAEERLKQLFSKNTGLCEAARRCIWADACPVPEGQGEGSGTYVPKPRAQAPVNGGRNYNGPKVAKFLVG